MASLDTFVELCVGGNIEFDPINDIIWYIDGLLRKIHSGVRRHVMEDTFKSELERIVRRLYTISGIASDDDEDTSDSDEFDSEIEDNENEEEQYENEEEDVYVFDNDGDDIHIEERNKNDNN